MARDWRYWCVIITMVGGGCASGQYQPRHLSSDLSDDLPKDMKERFDIKDEATFQAEEDKKQSLALAQAQAQAQASAKSAKKSRKKGKQNKQLPSLTAAPAPQPSASPSPVALQEQRIEGEHFGAGEKLTYTISYLGIPAGEVQLEVLPNKVVNGRRVYHVFGHATSAPVFSLVYRLNDTIESFIDTQELYSHRFHLILDEKKQQRDSIELYDSQKKQTFYWSRWEYPDRSKREIKETHDIPAHVQDSLSALFYLRTVPLANDSSVSFPLVTEGKTTEVVCSVVKREQVSSPMGRTNAVVVRPDVKYEGVLKKTGDSFIWFSDDVHRFPIRLEARVRIGTVVAELKKVEPASAPQRSSASVPAAGP